jgi:DNA-directed RNA polymerase subunit K/omega
VTYLNPERCAFEFVVLASLRTKQLIAGCLPRVAPRPKFTSTAALEVLLGKVTRQLDPPVAAGEQVRPA